MSQGKPGTAGPQRRISHLKDKKRKGVLFHEEAKELEELLLKVKLEKEEKYKKKLDERRAKIEENEKQMSMIGNDKETGIMRVKPITDVYYSQLRNSILQKPYLHPDELIHDIDLYFQSCFVERNGITVQIRPLTLSGLANALGVDRRTLANYADPNYPKQYDEALAPVIKKARSIIEQFYEEQLVWHKGNPAGLIFALKNFNSGWKDEHKVISEKVEPVQINYTAPADEEEIKYNQEEL